MRKSIVILCLCFSSGMMAAPTDSSAVRQLKGLEVLGIKQIPDGGLGVEAVTRISGAQARRLGIQSPKGVSIVAPNFYMPDYGSRITSSIYVRGLGARIDQPVVGLTVDNIPFLDKDAYDFDISDIASIDVLRGAQSVLNGRNTMGGQINIQTLSPLSSPGYRFSAEYGTANSIKVSGGSYNKWSDKFGSSLSAQFAHTDGFYTNLYSGEKTGRENSGSVRWKMQFRPTLALSVSNTAFLSACRQNGYPYEQVSTGEIAYNDTCTYRRTLFADGLTVAWAKGKVVVTSLTSVQYLNDRMDLDQDFTTEPYFTLRQAKKEWSFTEDLFTRGARGNYSWLGGVFAFWRKTDMSAPVTFKDIGIARLIESKRNEINPDYPIAWDSRRFILDSDFTLSSGGIAFYHESTFHLGNWRFEGGIRLDIERTSLDYHSTTSTGYSTYQRLPDGSLVPYSHTPIDIDDYGDLNRTYVEFLPKLAISYDGGEYIPYFSFSKGYKAGGYNTQMFSDVLQQRIMNVMGMASNYTLEEIVSYRPEKSFNYELGLHWKPTSLPLTADAALFYIDCRDQQLTVFPPGTVTGRLMTNAGRTRSYGVELSAKWNPVDDISVHISYGYTNATFRKYNDGKADYRGKYVPYAPSNTFFAQINWNISQLAFCGVSPSIEANARCAGQIYWNEANTLRQPFYCLPGLSISFTSEKWSLRLWAENISDTRYNSFYFLSMGNEFVQRGTPRRFGATVRVNLHK